LTFPATAAPVPPFPFAIVRDGFQRITWRRHRNPDRRKIDAVPDTGGATDGDIWRRGKPVSPVFKGWGGMFSSWTRSGRRSAAARRQRPWMQRALAGIDEALIVTDPQGVILFLNAFAETLTGWTQSAAAGRSLGEILRLADEQTRRPLEGPVLQALEENVATRWVRHTLLIRKDGEFVPVEYRIATFRSDGDRIGGAIVLVRDVAERAQVEKAMERMASIVENSEDAIVGIAMDGTIMTWNASAQRLYGYAAEDAVGQSFSLLYPRERSEELSEIWGRIKRGERISHYETQRLCRDGSRVEVSVSISPIKEVDGRIIGFSSIARDISERKRGEEERRRTEVLRGLADAQEEERRRIARELHDQMGQHLAALKMGLERLDDGPLDRDHHRHLHGLLKQIGQDVQRIALELRPTALDDLGLETAIVNYVEDWSGRSGVEVDLHATGLDHRRLPPPLETHLYRIVQEALTNVLKHAQAQRVSIIMERRPDHLLVIVEDDGRGFDHEAAASPQAGMPRLGLLGMKERVASVGGEFQVESSPGKGTALFIRIPLPATGE
jgi:PAS domain S-box-containing protein